MQALTRNDKPEDGVAFRLRDDQHKNQHSQLHDQLHSHMHSDDPYATLCTSKVMRKVAVTVPVASFWSAHLVAAELGLRGLQPAAHSHVTG